MTKADVKFGDFTDLAKHYSNSRPGYSVSVLDDLVVLLNKPLNEVDFVDVGAGTGIWTRMVYKKGLRSVVAVEPNQDMFSNGKSENGGASIHWIRCAAEELELPDASQDWITMASSFHWVNFDSSIKEFHRVLKPGGLFTALWNPRLIEKNPMLIEIESHLQTLVPDIKRVSSGLSGITESLTERFQASPYFENVVYLEDTHVTIMTPDRYITAWKSVNDIRVQLGPEKFERFLRFVEERLNGIEKVEATYLTRAWTVSRKD